MKIITLNANGIRSAMRKGLWPWLVSQDADIICFQETKAQEHQLDPAIFCPEGYHCYYYDAQKKGYSGVAIFAKQAPQRVVKGLGWLIADQEGRYIQLDYPQLSIASIYLPSGTSGPERQTIKFDFLTQLQAFLIERTTEKKPYILCGDLNIAHTKNDIKNWRGNQKNSGFLPEERAWLDHLFDDLNYVDAFREVNQEPDQYTWWSNRGQAWAKNVGWRIDYQVLTPELKGSVRSAKIYKEQRFSDHAPLIIEYDVP